MIVRPRYLDLQPGEPPAGYDVVELKYDGCFAIARIADGSCTFISRTGKVIETRAVSPTLPPMTLVGELLRGTTWSRETGRTGQFVVFDLYAPNKPLRIRRRAIERLFRRQGWKVASLKVEGSDLQPLTFKPSNLA